MKAGTQSGRRSDRETAQLKLADIYKTTVITDKTAEDVQKHRKAMAHPREDFIAMIIAFCKEKGIKYCSAPFEADWQLVSLQKQGIIQHILSSDGDLLVLGGDSIVTDLNYGSGACCIYDTNAILQRKSMGGGMFLPQHLPLLACFSGNDYIARLHGNGPKKTYAMPEEYFIRGLDMVALLNDGKDFVTDTVRINSCISRGQYSDKMKSSAGRFIAWTLPCGLSVTYSPLFLGRISEKAIVEYWGGTTWEFFSLIQDD
eukprot:scaffold276_cov47-Cyclotella_meneghiniana.AAC.8